MNSYTSSRQLTQPNDKCPALSGIATLFQEKLGDKYIAGGWKADLERSLIWRLGNYTGPRDVAWKEILIELRRGVGVDGMGL